MDETAVSRLRKCRGVVRASITCLGIRVKELESKPVDHTTVDVAQRLKEKLEHLILSSQLIIMPSLMQLMTKNLLKRIRKSSMNITGIAGLSHKSHNQSVTHFTVSTTRTSGKGLMLLLSLSHVSLVISLSTLYS